MIRAGKGFSILAVFSIRELHEKLATGARNTHNPFLAVSGCKAELDWRYSPG